MQLFFFKCNYRTASIQYKSYCCKGLDLPDHCPTTIGKLDLIAPDNFMRECP